MPKCPKCGSTVLMDHLRVLGFRRDIEIEAYANPRASIFRDAATSKVEATVCGYCGYTEFFALDFASLVIAVRQSEEREKGE